MLTRLGLILPILSLIPPTPAPMKMTPMTERVATVPATLLVAVRTAGGTKRKMATITINFPGLSKLLEGIEIRLYYRICQAWMDLYFESTRPCQGCLDCFEI